MYLAQKHQPQTVRKAHLWLDNILKHFRKKRVDIAVVVLYTMNKFSDLSHMWQYCYTYGWFKCGGAICEQ